MQRALDRTRNIFSGIPSARWRLSLWGILRFLILIASAILSLILLASLGVYIRGLPG